ncbi:Cadmium, zinc and cobalt-transporting ATPase [bioreactor metagenome]|uniref:Cadmium, zinc and cobalt-transporting ATPase n=1 Tax=bioreactor metagenome TaxID=1076179 RepID=A0A645GUY0_9ZZZZ
MGVKVESAGATIYAGNARLMRQIGLEQPEAASGTTVHVVRDGRYLGAIRIADRLRGGVRATLDELRGLGVERLAMLTGDNRAAAETVAAEAGLDLWRAGLLPQDKVGELERLMATEKPGRKTVFVGDGINDAPVLARADLGIAMGVVGSDAAIEAADVVVMNDDLARIALAIRIARKTRRIVWQNILFALGCKGAILLLAVTGHVSVWVAIFADVGVALLAVANSMRALRSGHPNAP